MISTDLTDFSLTLRTESYDYRTPMKFGGRVVSDVTVLSVDCDAALSNGARATGFGSMTMGVAWAWPDVALTDTAKLEAVIELTRRFIDSFNESSLSGHPLDICHVMSECRDSIAREVAVNRGLERPIPELAVLLALSPIEAALFDAQGKAAKQSSFALLSRDHLIHDLGHYLDDSYKGVHLSDLIAAKPAREMPLYHLVGALDPLTDADVETPVADGLPETLGQWIKRDGLTHLKIKLAGDDRAWDVDRILRIARVACESKQQAWAFSLDFNEKCEDEDYVLTVLDRLLNEDKEALQFIQYIEQPTNRDLHKEPNITMHRVAERLPVVIDESLINLKSLRTAIEQGYSGIALKACKGHAEALLLGAVAAYEKRFLCVQDLTCVGASLLHSASLAAHIPSVTAIESNGRQYAPKANQRWMDRFGSFFEVRGGSVPTGMLDGPGLGYGDDPAFDIDS